MRRIAFNPGKSTRSRALNRVDDTILQCKQVLKVNLYMLR